MMCKNDDTQYENAKLGATENKDSELLVLMMNSQSIWSMSIGWNATSFTQLR